MSNFGHFWHNLQFWSTMLILVFSFDSKLFKSTPKFFKGYMTIGTHVKIQNRDRWSTYRSACANLIVNFEIFSVFWEKLQILSLF